MVNGKPACIPDSEAYCQVVGEPHYRTFDGYYYDFQGTCTYTIAKTCNGDKDLPTFNIEAKKENRGSTRAAYTSYVNVQMYGQTISLMRNENGFVRVNNQRQSLPINLNDILLYQSGGSVIIDSDLLKVHYDWNSVLKLSVAKSFSGSVCGLCGNYNGNPSDDLMSPDGVKTTNLVDFGERWKVEDGDRSCRHDCNGECKSCPLDTQQKYVGEQSCGLLSKVLNGPFAKCHSVIDPKQYVDYCVYDLCMNAGSKLILCQSLKTYAEACQRSKVDIGEWRSLAGCPMQCPANSEYKLCSKACQATCNDDATPSLCADLCVESCQCKEGYVLDKGKCVPKANCGCLYQGKLYAPNEKFWGDKKCEQQCTCNPTTKKVECKATRCKPSETCSVVNGIQNCYPVSYGTCSSSGDSHYISFDGLRFDFQGTCIYQFAGLCKKADDLVDFQVNVQNEIRGSKVMSYTSAVQVKLYDFDISIDRRYKDRILVNGLLTNLPFVVDNGKLSIYKQGNSAVLQTSFGLRVTYNWDSYTSVTLPGTYAGAVCGLCGNFDGKPENDLTMKNKQLTIKLLLFGNSWKVQNVPGCYEKEKGECITLALLELFPIKNKQGCGILKDKTGPFRECHAKINPDGHYKSCVYDACFYENRPDVICKSVASYAKVCQEAGVTIYAWRTDKFCSPNCPKNSHYEVCASGCSPTCLSLSPPLGCNPVCSEGCQCDDDFILSGGDCVPISKCGCKYNDKYYKMGEVFYPSGLCDQKCVCTESGAVECNTFTCGANEECKVVDGVQKCQPIGSAQCSAAGNSHYMSFNGRVFDFLGTCTYTLAKMVTNNANLVPFAINVKNEKRGNGRVAVSKLVSFDVYGYNLILQKEVPGQIMVNGVYNNIPVNLEDGKIRAYQHGMRVIIATDFGVQVNYDLDFNMMVTAPANYKNQLGGLCGNYNSDRQDDFQLPDKSVTADATAFGASWKVQIPGVTCDDGCGGSGNPCPSCDDKKKEIFKTENYCGFLKKPEGPLNACYGTINPDTYFNNCVYDLCAAAGDGDILCQSIHSYVAACQAAGVTIQPWRTDAFCPLTCPANSKYKVCADVCSSTCAGITDPAKCPETCSEGCECNDGFFFDGKNCVSMDNCGCFEDGKYYQEGESFLSADCRQQCKCQAGCVTCTDAACGYKERCGLVNGVRGCYKTESECTVSQQKFTTYDGLSGGPLANGPIQVTTLCNTYSAEWFRVITDVRECPGAAATVVKLFILHRQGLVNISKDKKAVVNGLPCDFPIRSGIISAHAKDTSISIQIGENLKIEFSNTGSVSMRTLQGLSEAVCGACGNFNGNSSDDLKSPEGKSVTNINDLMKSWSVPDGNSCNA